jgi:hypothetical protein
VTNPACPLPGSNPFSTRFTRPGAIPYWFGPGTCAGDLARKLSAAGWRGQIVGLHGSGKSTLLAALVEPLARQGRRPWFISLHEGQRRLPSGWARQARRAGAKLIVIDGYEQLGTRWRLWTRSCCRRRDWGLLVTAHRDVGFPTVWSTASDAQAAQAIVARLLADGDVTFSRQLVADSLAAAGGNMREMLFALYDEYERQRRLTGS